MVSCAVRAVFSGAFEFPHHHFFGNGYVTTAS
jgi:hypothetical protein